MTILDKIADSARRRVEAAKASRPAAEVKALASLAVANDGFPFEKALAVPGVSFICEVKKASPSRGVISDSFPYLEIALDYERAGAAAISVLTEPEYFRGADKYLREIAGATRIPALRKDFIVDEYQIYEAKTLGASAILLICALLGGAELARYINLAHSLGISVLAETHDETEVRSALAAGARVIGANNRDLKTFEVDIGVSARLRRIAPEDTLFVVESGVKTREAVRFAEEIGASAILIGEAAMLASDKTGFLNELRGVNG
jgi:indole-3-glycerol phosphate synthase